MGRAGLASVSARLTPFVVVILFAALALLPGLGVTARLTYHEAFIGQGVRELLDSGDWSYVTIGGLPWLEKPPLPWWLAASASWCVGGVSEWSVRLPSALAGMILALGVTLLASRHFGLTVGILAGAMQATTVWAVTRGRLAEADILLACVLTWTLLAFVRLRLVPDSEPQRLRSWQLAFFGLLAATSLIKGIGFGAALIVAILGTTLLWDRDRKALRRLSSPWAWASVTAVSLAWPIAMVARHGMGALSLWTLHITDRLATRPEQFAGESWWAYGSGILIQGLPWAPLAFFGAWRSLGRAVAVRERDWVAQASLDRLLWAWSLVPLLLLSLATVKNAHYVIYAQVPWSIWAALGLTKLAERLQCRGWNPRRLRRSAAVGFTSIAMAWGLSFWAIGPWLDRRGVEWAFYEKAGHQVPPGESVAFLYDDWDRKPYPTPFGPMPHDLAVRLFYLNRPACWHFDPQSLADCPRVHSNSSEGLTVIGRERDRAALERIGPIEVLADSPPVRFDRTYLLMRIKPEPRTAQR